MHKEKILEILESAKDDNGAVPMRLVRTAFDKLLEPCEDTISRQTAIDVYGDWYVEEGTADGFIGTVKQLLEGLPSAQPERKTGHWIEASVAGMPALYHEKCGAFVYAPNGKKGFNFCPNCGADMRGEQE